MSGVFLSYRRDDSSGYAGRLAEDLRKHFGVSSVFKDIDSIGIGLDFVEAIEKALESCDVLLVLIGREWLTAVDKKGNRRLDDRRTMTSENSSRLWRRFWDISRFLRPHRRRNGPSSNGCCYSGGSH